MTTINTINFNTPFLLGVPNSRISPEWIRLLGTLITIASVAPSTSDEFQQFFDSSRYPAAQPLPSSGQQDMYSMIQSMRSANRAQMRRLDELEAMLVVGAARTSSAANSIAVADDITTNSTVYPTFANGSAGQRRLWTSSTKITFNPSTAKLTMAGSVAAHGATAIPAGGTGGAGFLFSSTANFGVFFGSGTPTLSAAKGSLYLRSDGSTTNDRAYINTNGTTTWTAVTTAA